MIGEWIHACPLCGSSREARSATIVDPFCTRCGGILVARSGREEATLQQRMERYAPQLPSAFGQLLKWTLAGLLVVGGFRVGANAGGLWLAFAAAAGVVLLLAPLLIPDGETPPRGRDSAT